MCDHGLKKNGITQMTLQTQLCLFLYVVTCPDLVLDLRGVFWRSVLSSKIKSLGYADMSYADDPDDISIYYCA